MENINTEEPRYIVPETAEEEMERRGKYAKEKSDAAIYLLKSSPVFLAIGLLSVYWFRSIGLFFIFLSYVAWSGWRINHAESVIEYDRVDTLRSIVWFGKELRRRAPLPSDD